MKPRLYDSRPTLWRSTVLKWLDRQRAIKTFPKKSERPDLAGPLVSQRVLSELDRYVEQAKESPEAARVLIAIFHRMREDSDSRVLDYVDAACARYVYTGHPDSDIPKALGLGQGNRGRPGHSFGRKPAKDRKQHLCTPEEFKDAGQFALELITGRPGKPGQLENVAIDAVINGFGIGERTARKALAEARAQREERERDEVLKKGGGKDARYTRGDRSKSVQDWMLNPWPWPTTAVHPAPREEEEQISGETRTPE